MLADAGGEYYHVHAVQNRGVCADVLFDSVCEHVYRQLGALVARFFGGDKIAEIAAYAAYSLNAAILVEVADGLIGVPAFLAAKELHDGRIDIAATRTHYKTFERSEAHGRIHALAVLDCRQAGAVAEVAHDEFEILRAHYLGSFLGDVFMAYAVSAVSADLKRHIVLIVDTVKLCDVGHGAVRRVEHCDVRHVRHDGSASVDTHQTCGHMQRSKLDYVAYMLARGIVHKRAVGKVLTACDRAMSYGRYLIDLIYNAIFGIRERIEHELDRHCVRGHIVLYHDIFLSAVFKEGVPHAYPVRHAFSKHGLVFHFEQSVFKRRASRIDDKYLHRCVILPCILFCVARLERRYGDGQHYVLSAAAARQIVERLRESLADRSDGYESAQTLGYLIADVACVDVGEDEHVCLTRDLAVRSLDLRHLGNERRIELELAVQFERRLELLGKLGRLCHFLHGVAVLGVAARSLGRERKHCDSGIYTGYGLRSVSGGNGDLRELFGRRADIECAVCEHERAVLAILIAAVGSDHYKAAGHDVGAGAVLMT